MKQGSEAVNVPACFISNHEGFLGSIKNFIEDFVVTEIDIDGHHVKTESAMQTPGCASSGGNNKSSAEFLENSHSSVSQDADVSLEWGVDVPLPGLGSFDLGVILGQSVSEELEHFVLTLRDEKPPELELSLGSFADKHQRANVHRAVRHRFPFLMTVTIQPEIRVREDPDYRELSQLVKEDEAEDFFRFIDAKVRGSSYTFGPDDNKEHRTAVHHFLNRRFGKLVETKSFIDQGRTSISVRLRERGRPKKRTAEERKEEEVYTGKDRLCCLSGNRKVILKSRLCVCFFQHSLCVRRTWRLWRPSATWQQLSGFCRPISPTPGSRTREPSPTSPWWSRRSHLNGRAVFQ